MITSHELARQLLDGPDVKVGLIVTSGKFQTHRHYKMPLVTYVTLGSYNRQGIKGAEEDRMMLVAEHVKNGTNE